MISYVCIDMADSIAESQFWRIAIWKPVAIFVGGIFERTARTHVFEGGQLSRLGTTCLLQIRMTPITISFDVQG